jgi:hypothetical protein
MAHVLIVIHRDASFDEPAYVLREVADVWRAAGHRVTVRHGPDADAPRVAADLAVLHVDLTRAPDDHVACVRAYPRTINAAVVDISKSAVSEHLVRPGDGYDGPVIVKTTWNCGGMRERQLARRRASPVARLARADLLLLPDPRRRASPVRT